MKRIELSVSPNSPNFIGAWKLEPTNICDDLIDYFEDNKSLHKKGETGQGIKQEVKRSTDITIQPKQLKSQGNEVLNSYLEKLLTCYEDYIKQWSFLSQFLNKVHVSSFNMQRYYHGDHFKVVHSERMGLDTSHRLFAWMTYLNDVESGGETEFSHYGIQIKPKKGKTLIWPSEWTHAHCGNVLNSGVKYIITGWMHFPN